MTTSEPTRPTPKPRVAGEKTTAATEHVVDAINELVVLRAAISMLAMEEFDSRAGALIRSISPDEFLYGTHSAIWQALRKLVDQKLDYSPAVVRRMTTDLGIDVDETHLADLEATAVVPTNLDWHVSTMRWDATRARILQGAVPTLIKDLRDPLVTHEKASSSALAISRALESGRGRRFIHRKDELRRQYDAEIEGRIASGGRSSFGFTEMDPFLTEGSMPGRTCVVTGLSGSGKSTWTSMLAPLLAKQDRRVLYAPWEMGTKSTLDIMVAGMTGIAVTDIVQGNLDVETRNRVRRATWWITDKIQFMYNAFFDDELRKTRSNDRCLDVLEGYIAESGCDVIIMDLWERCLVDLSYEGMTTALYKQQNMHERYNVFGIIVQQIRLKDVERRADKRPTREGIKGTGAFVEVADLVFGVHRSAQFKRVPDDTIEVICLKQRKGAANWAIAFEWDGATAMISNGREVSYDPGLESESQFGDVADIKTSAGDGPQPSPSGRRRKPTRRDQA